MNLHTKLVSLRKEKGLTQLDLAERLNVSRQAISRWEVGTAVPSIDNLKILGELYGVPVDYLLDDTADSFDGEPQPSAQFVDSPVTDVKNKTHRIFYLCLTAFLLIAALSIFSLIQQQPQADEPVPFSQMDSDIITDCTIHTFTLD